MMVNSCWQSTHLSKRFIPVHAGLPCGNLCETIVIANSIKHGNLHMEMGTNVPQLSGWFVGNCASVRMTSWSEPATYGWGYNAMTAGNRKRVMKRLPLGKWLTTADCWGSCWVKTYWAAMVAMCPWMFVQLNIAIESRWFLSGRTPRNDTSFPTQLSLQGNDHCFAACLRH